MYGAETSFYPSVTSIGEEKTETTRKNQFIVGSLRVKWIVRYSFGEKQDFDGKKPNLKSTFDKQGHPTTY